jgi:hypothetical protein
MDKAGRIAADLIMPSADEKKRKRVCVDAAMMEQLLEENQRLRDEVGSLRSQLARRETQQLRAEAPPIVVKKALNLAGFWNVHPNDVLMLTPRLVEEFERETGICPIHGAGVPVCFPAAERERLVDILARLMPRELPKYRRHV